MSRWYQVSPPRWARELASLDVAALPDDGFPLIETTGFEVVDDPSRANDNGAPCHEDEARVLPFAAGLPRVK